MEQAYAQLNGGYANIDNGGQCDAVWELITGESASSENVQGPFSQDTDEEIADLILDAWNGQKSIMIGTLESAANLPGNHAYSVMDVHAPAGVVTSIEVYNPWGERKVLSLDHFNENISRIYIGDRP